MPPRKYLSPRPLPPTKSHISTVPPCFPSSNLHCCLLAAQPPRRRPFFLQRHLLAGYPSSCSAASSPVTLLLAARPPRRRPFFLLHGLLATDPSSCCAASSIWSGNPHPTHTILLLSRPTCPDRRCDTVHQNHCPLLQLSAAHSHFACSIMWSSVACRRTRARGRYGCHACRSPDLGGAPRL